MTNKINDGGPAFPCDELVERIDGKLSGAPVTSHGMSLRDWFAGQAMMGLISNHTNSGAAEELAKVSYGISDAMLAAREKRHD